MNLTLTGLIDLTMIYSGVLNREKGLYSFQAQYHAKLPQTRHSYPLSILYIQLILLYLLHGQYRLGPLCGCVPRKGRGDSLPKAQFLNTLITVYIVYTINCINSIYFDQESTCGPKLFRW